MRWTAVAIAIAAAVDPAMIVSTHDRPRIAVISEFSSGNQMEAYVSLSRSFQIVPAGDPSAAATVVVGDRYPEVPIPESARVATVDAPSGPGGRFVLSAPRSVPAGSTIHLEAELRGRRGMSRELIATIGNVIVGRASHTWNDNAAWRASFDVVPVGQPPYEIAVSAPGVSGPRATAMVDVSERLPVLVYEARPSWAATFVRRALEQDPRFVVGGSDAVSKGVAVRTANPQSGLAELDRFGVVIVGGVDALTASDAAALDRFMVERGGSVALLPDTRDVGRLLSERPALSSSFQKEVLLERPAPLVTDAPLPRVDSSELLTFAPPAGARVLARTESSPIVWMVPRGEGRLLVSGALDAWRFRSAEGVDFDRFWTSTIAGLALATRPPLSIDVAPAMEFAGAARVRVRMRGVDPSQPLSATAALASGEPVRLWPGPERGSFNGIVSAYRPGLNRIDVVVTNGGRIERGSARFAAGVSMADSEEPVVPLSLLSATRGGIDVTADDLPKLERWLRETIPAKTTTAERHPMRSPWWIVPFAGCLCGEWWVRRRGGFR